MSGYTPLFSTLTTGTLCGKWPDIGLWPIILSLADRNGIVDKTHEYISAVTGLPVADVRGCMERFCASDPGSRSEAQQGARLLLLDLHRDWGWKVVNHEHYREKARLAAKNARDVASGKEAGRKTHGRKSAAVRRCPPDSAAVRPLQTQTQTREEASPPSWRTFPNLNVEAVEKFVAYREKRKPKLLPDSIEALAKKLARLSPDTQAGLVELTIANGWQGIQFDRADKLPKETGGHRWI